MPLGSDFAGGLANDDWWRAIAGLGQQPTYDTQLTPEQEQAYQAWKLQNAPRDSGADYDLRGAFQAGLSPDPQSGHWPDTFKKPGHPTFSNQSQYAAARPDLAGSWQGDNYIPPVAPSGAEMFRGAVIPASKGFQHETGPAPIDDTGQVYAPNLPPQPGPPQSGFASQIWKAMQADPTGGVFERGAAPIEAIPNRPKTAQELAARVSAGRNQFDPLEAILNVGGGPSAQAVMPLLGAARRGLGQQLANTIESRLASPTTSFGQSVQFGERLPPVPVRPPPPTEPTGSLNPLDNQTVFFRGKQPAQFTPEDWQAFGQHHGTDKPLGPLSPLQTVVTDAKTGKTISIPGGTEGEWTYYDLLHMKANPINPNEIPPALHTQMQQKMGRTMTPVNAEPTDAQVWNGLIFGMTSPSNPLTRNQLAQSRLRLRDPKMLDDLASSIPWKAGDDVPKSTRLIASKRIADQFGLGAAKSGGLGVRGNADYTRIAELAQMFKENPQFFRKQPGETWQDAVERISSQVPGLAMKTGSFGTVWQDPAKASVSAIDRHMVRRFEKEGSSNLFASPEQRADFESRAVKRYNKGRRGDDRVSTFAELTAKPGTSDHIAGMLLEHVGATSSPKFRLKGGEVNPNIPQHLAEASWPVEPQNVKLMGDSYKRALDLNQQIAQKHGLGLFNSQWLTWDKIRQRLEPHENMFPGLEKTPAPSMQQLRDVIAAHRKTGHIGKENVPTKSLLQGSPSQLGYLGLGGALGGASMLPRNEEDQ